MGVTMPGALQSGKTGAIEIYLPRGQILHQILTLIPHQSPRNSNGSGGFFNVFVGLILTFAVIAVVCVAFGYFIFAIFFSTLAVVFALGILSKDRRG